MAMFTIGEFARLGHVPVKTLRYYDEIGLFTPAEVDPLNGYRRYAAVQLADLNRVLALKALGLSLEQIRRFVGQAVTAAELHGLLLLHRTQIEADLAEARQRIADIGVRLDQIEREHTMSDPGILTKAVPAITFTGAREVVASADLMRERCIALDTQACRAIAELRLEADGPSWALYYPNEEAIDVEMGYPVRPPVRQVPESHRLASAVHVLPAVDVAYAVYAGSYDDFGAVGQLHVALREWVTAHEVTSADPVREIYLQPPTDQHRHGVMELQYPLR